MEAVCVACHGKLCSELTAKQKMVELQQDVEIALTYRAETAEAELAAWHTQFGQQLSHAVAERGVLKTALREHECPGDGSTDQPK